MAKDGKVDKVESTMADDGLLPVQLVGEGERLQYKHGRSTFYYRRLSGQARTMLMAKHTKRGNLNVPNYTQAAIRHCVIGWDGVHDASGNPVEFDKDLVAKLPDDITDDIAELAAAGIVDAEAKAKN